jgi:hypothetical protein
MERKKLIRRAAIVGLGVLLACAVAAFIAWRRLDSGWKQQVRERDEHVAQLTQEYQAYLDGTVKKIKGLPVDPHVIGEIQTRHYQERPARWIYVWASTNTGDFSFGVPADAFLRLNAAYDQYQAVIARDNFYAGRDQFLRTLLHARRPIALPQKDNEKDQEDERELGWWRFFREEREHNLYLSSPIQTAAGATVGNLNLKLVDEKDARLYESSDRHVDDDPWFVVLPVAGGIAVLAVVWLWFLLPSWVYIDARERGVPRPLIWAALTVPGTIFALMVYLVSRPAGLPELRCPQCSKALNGSKAGCPYCGADLSAAFCTQCQYPLKPDWAFCPSCRAPTPATATA